ncbi:MAG: prepilin-type N-terminal cleavage/methylation domain-containing protein [Patescibacteria group bacterium]|nr:prepilin-type N-terminal cleavage/methylation domain-containing protein [Patescibacteria group bacterium]
MSETLGGETQPPVMVRGFTLIEILVASAIFVLVVSTLFDVLVSGQRVYGKGQNRNEILQNGRVVLDRLSREIRQAKEMVSPLPQAPDDPGFLPAMAVEFQDGHSPSPFAYLNSDYYYIRYSVATTSKEITRQYRVYCFEDCASCSSFYRWNAAQVVGGETTMAHACNLSMEIVGEYVSGLKFWGSSDLINIKLDLLLNKEILNLSTKVFGANL